MTDIVRERMTARQDGDIVVFLIGMRINRPWKVGKWLSVVMAMGRMLRELGEHPELGFLGGDSWLGRTTIMVSYWRSMDALLGYAKSRERAHLPAWRAFNKLIGTNGDVGIWHETMRVRPGDYENVYVNMVPFGLGKAVGLVPASGPRATAEGRLGRGAPAVETVGSGP